LGIVGIVGFLRAVRAPYIDVVTTNQLVGPHEEISYFDRETLPDLAIDLQASLLGIRESAVTLDASCADAAGSVQHPR